jgi:Reverse transcriptase (RNA-dependent DNA polymerase)
VRVGFTDRRILTLLRRLQALKRDQCTGYVPTPSDGRVYRLPRRGRCVTTLDCNNGYWQIPVDPVDCEKTAFTSHFGVYQFRRLPFGLRNATGTIQWAIDIILSAIKWKKWLVHLDDVIIFSSSRDMHLKHVNEALNLLGKAGLSLKLIKCHLFKEAVDYLGHVIRPGKLAVSEKNTASLRNAPVPKTQTELLGLFNVYRRFVPHFATVAAPLISLLGKGTSPQLGDFSPQQIDAFNTLRDKLLPPPVLGLPRATGKIWLDIDASDGQLGTCLFMGTARRKDAPAWVLVPDPEPGRAQLFRDGIGVPRYRMGRDAPKDLSGREQLYCANGLSRTPMGNEPV